VNASSEEERFTAEGAEGAERKKREKEKFSQKGVK
jgi:hypothetical protein